MPSSFSPNLRITLQASDENSNTWGTITNTNLGTVLEQAIAGWGVIDVTILSVTLTVVDGDSDQARNAILSFTGTPASPATVYAPNGVTKMYVAYNSTTQNVTLAVASSSGTTVMVPAGACYQVVCDGTNIIRVT